MLLGERRCVANDVTVAAGQTLLISGPNAGGKTVALKTVGLAAVMARAGLHLTCESGSVIGWFHDIVTDIGDAQNLEKDLSTFSGHIVNLRDLLISAAPGVLVLIDEIAVGTDPDQGASLAQAVLEALAVSGVTGMVTTHYDRLKTLGTGQDARFANASVGFDMEKLEPTFKLHLGSPGSSGALAVATRMGLAKAVVERARELIGAEGVKVEDLLANVADQRRRIEQERVVLLSELELAEADRATVRLERDRSNARYEKQLRAVHGEALSALRGARREIEEVRKELRGKQLAAVLTIEDLRLATRHLVPAGGEISRLEPKRKLPPGTPATVEALVVGAPVIVPRLGRCEVVAVPHDGKVEVRLGAMRALVPIEEVLMDSHRAARAAERERERQPDSEKPDGNQVVMINGVPAGGKASSRTIDSTIDVRGQRADEAVSAVDRFLDESLVAARDTAFVVHGHGTGALRSAIREHLGAHKGIEKFRAGESNEGGDGVTVAFLK